MFLIVLFSLFIVNYLLFIEPVSAQCPVCIVTVGGGMLIAQKLGVDDSIMALWISALNTVISFWLAPKIKIKLLNSPLILSVLMLITTWVYFSTTGQIIDFQTPLGLAVGFVSVVSGNLLYQYSKIKNNGKAIFPYSKVIFPFISVLLVTFIFKLLFKL